MPSVLRSRAGAHRVSVQVAAKKREERLKDAVKAVCGEGYDEIGRIFQFSFVGNVSWTINALYDNTNEKLSDIASAAKRLSDTFNWRRTLTHVASFTMGIIVLGCASGMADNFSDPTGQQFCYLSEDLGGPACSLTQWLGSLSAFGALCWMFRDNDWRGRDKTWRDRLLEHTEIGFCAACALAYFADFC